MQRTHATYGAEGGELVDPQGVLRKADVAAVLRARRPAERRQALPHDRFRLRRNGSSRSGGGDGGTAETEAEAESSRA